jgi:general secretion pathway protein A
MSYYTIAGLQKEPFSTSPDPEFFYNSSEHESALIRLMIEIRLRRGLSLILGDVGTGKTTLSRRLVQMFHQRQDIIFHIIMDPAYSTSELFLESLVRAMGIKTSDKKTSIVDYQEAIKNYLFKMGVEERKTIVLMVDEAQKLNKESLEILRVLLNYETNEYKLLQLVLFGQMELLPVLKGMPNLMDRVSLKYVLNPLDEKQTKEMILFRLKKAGYVSPLPLFTDEAINEIYEFSGGYPRKITMLCHQALKELIIEKKTQVDRIIAAGLIKKERQWI